MVETVKPKRKVSQAPIKFTACFCGCGAQVEYRTTPRVYLPECKIIARRDSARVAMEKQRRKRGIAQQKGVTANCSVCGCGFIKNSLAHKRCDGCAETAYRQRTRAASVIKRQNAEGRAYNSRYHRERRRRDPSVRVSSHIRTLIYRGIGKRKAGRSWREFVPYTLADLMAHLEKQFLPGMTWENHGEWHIDHIRPLCSFEFQTPECPQFGEAWALNNLQPLWAIDNIRKGGRWEPPA